jgi:hypothetical protein
MGSSGCDAGVHDDGTEALRVLNRQQRGHARARGEAGDGDAIRSPPYKAQTWSTACMIDAVSPWARPDEVSYQFQQPFGFDSRSCIG